MCVTMSHILRMNNWYVLMRVSTSTHIILFTHTFFTRRGVHCVYKYKQTVTFMSFVCNFGSDRWYCETCSSATQDAASNRLESISIPAMQKVSEFAAFLIEARRCLTEEQREDHEAAREFCRSCCQAAGAEPAFDFLEDFWVAMTLAQCGLTEGGNIDGSGMGPRKHDNIQGLRKINPYQLESMVRE